MVENPPQGLLETLTYQHKNMEFNGGPNAEVTKSTVQLYARDDKNEQRFITYQGFKDDLVAWCAKRNHPVTLVDERVVLPPPQLALAGGFRGTQRRMFLELLRHQRSGLLKAPTRFGKTKFLVNCCRVWPGQKTVLAAPGVDLLGQLVGELKEQMPDREVLGIFTGSRNSRVSDDITVCSLDSLGKTDTEGTKLLLVDEPHAAVSPSRLEVLQRFDNARIYGFGATVSGRFDNADKIIHGVFGPVLVEKTFQEAVQEGAICPIRVYLIRMPIPHQSFYNRNQAYRSMIYASVGFNRMVLQICRNQIPEDWQTVVFVDEKKQAGLVSELVRDAAVAVASDLGAQERRDLFGKMVANEIKRCVATDIFSTGVTFPDLRVVVNACGGGGSITGTQKPGRLAQMRPGKKRGYLVDFLWTSMDKNTDKNAAMVQRDAWSRRGVYLKNGYDVVELDDPANMILD